MPCNCCSTGLEEVFDDRMARREAAHFRRRGLTVRSRRLLAGIRDALSIDGASTLEVGAGVGALTISLLREGASAASIIDAAPAYVATARSLAAEYGVADHLSLALGNYADAGHEPVDVIVMDRVVCCHPRWKELLEPAATHAKRAIALTYPRNAWWTRAGVGMINFVQKLRGMVFRVWVHPPAAMHDLLRGQGFTPRVIGHRGPWEIMVATRNR
jgi:Methyltransferase domain